MNGSDKNNAGRATRMVPTRFGWLFVVALACMLMGSINYNNNLGFLFTFLLVSMALISMFHTYRNLDGLAVEAVRSQPVFESQDAVFDVTLRPLSAAHFGLWFRLDGSRKTRVRSTADAGNRIAVIVSSPPRGRVSVAQLEIVSEYPFGLFRVTRSLPVTGSCLVYPQPTPLHQLTAQDLMAAHEPHGAVNRANEDFKGLRVFQNGDALKHVFWKAFSKGQGLLVKEFMQSASPEVCLNWEKIRSRNKEKKLSILCAMVLKAHKSKMIYGLSLPGQFIAPHWGKQHKHACLRALALF